MDRNFRSFREIEPHPEGNYLVRIKLTLCAIKLLVLIAAISLDSHPTI